MSGLVTIERLLHLFSGQPKHGELAAERLARIAAELGPDGDDADTPSPQVQLLRRIAGYLPRSQWDCRVASALALEKVGMAMAAPGLRSCLFGTRDHERSGAVGLMALSRLDLEVVLRDGELLMASGGEEYTLSGRGGPLTREQLEEQKAAIMRRLGLEWRDMGARTAMQIGGVEGLGIGDRDLEEASGTVKEEEGEEEEGSSRGGGRSRKKRRKLSEVTGTGKAAAAAAGGGGGVAAPPWLAEQLGVRLFDAKWEARHGAALGLMGLWKAWRAGQRRGKKQPQPSCGQGAGPGLGWLRRVAEDVLCRCVCVLSLDRFADYSLGGSTVAPVREVAAQLLALLLTAMLEMDHDDDTEGRAMAAAVVGQLEVLGSFASEWEVRHGAMLALKYLAAALHADKQHHGKVDPERLVALGLVGLSDGMDDVKDAAATALLSIILTTSSSAPGRTPPLARLLRPVLSRLPEAEEGSPHLHSFLRLALHCLQPPPASAAQEEDDEPCHVSPALVGRLWRLGLEGDAGVRALAVRLLAELVKAAGGGGGGGGGGEGRLGLVLPSDTRAALGLPLQWRVYEALSTVTNPPGLPEALLGLWGALLQHGQQEEGEAGLGDVLLEHYFCTDTSQPVPWTGRQQRSHVDPQRCQSMRACASLCSPQEPPDCRLCVRRGQACSFTGRRHVAQALAQLAAHRPAVLALDAVVESLRSSTWACVREAAALLIGAVLSDAPRAVAWGSQAQAQEALMGLLDGPGAEDDGSWVLSYEELRPYLPSVPTKQQPAAPGLVRVALPPASASSSSPSTSSALVHSSFTALHRRVQTAAASALAMSANLPAKVGPLVKALMQAVKAEADPPRLALAVEALARLVEAVVSKGPGAGRKAVDKAVANLCVLSCAFDPQDPGLAAARNAARDALRALADRLGSAGQTPAPDVFHLLPVLWERVGVPITTDPPVGVSKATEDALRLVLVLLPHLPAGSGLGRLLSLRWSVYQRAVGESEGKLVNRLAARCLSQLLPRHGPELAADVGPDLEARLTDRTAEEDEQQAAVEQAEGGGQREGRRARAAHCLLEMAQAVKAWASEASRACLPHLLPAALAVVADQDPLVRGPGGEAFRLLAELAPLLDRQAWGSSSSTATAASSSSCYDNVIRLVLGEQLAPLPLPSELVSVMRGGLELRPYQVQGVQWLSLLAQAGLNGALCDDMGLGKTVQVLATLALHRLQHQQASSQRAALPPSIVVCPASLCGHWLSEARRFFSHDVMDPVIFPPGLSRDAKTELLGPRGPLGSSRGLLIISYGLMRREVEVLCRRAWDYAVFDEGHVLRNDRSAMCRAARRLVAAHRVVLSGTPVQNHVHELWPMFDLLMPGLLGHSRADFQREYGRPIGRATLRSASSEATAEAIGKLEQLQAHLLPFLLRRDKATVLRELPPKVVMDVHCRLSPLQQRMYASYCRTGEVQAVLQELRALAGQDASLSSSSLANGSDALRQLGAQALRLLHHLRLLCVHPALVLDRQTPETAAAREKLMDMAECSGKLMALKGLLASCGVIVTTEDEEEVEEEEEEGAEAMEVEDQAVVEEEEEEEEEEEPEEAKDKAAEGQEEASKPEEGGPSPEEGEVMDGGLHRCLIFAQHRDTLDAIERALLRHVTWHPGYGPWPHDDQPRFLRLDGQVPPARRQELVQRFNSDRRIPLMLLTTRVGGLGLNLTGADTVIFVEHDWNPQVDLQAMDRAHRIGQDRSVSVFRLVTASTVEEQILSLQSHKQAIARAVVTAEQQPTGGEGRGAEPGAEGGALERRMARVVDLVSASLGQAPASSSSSSGSSSSRPAAPHLSLLQATGVAGPGQEGDGSWLPPEEVWGEEQYNSFQVHAFLHNVLGDPTEDDSAQQSQQSTQQQQLKGGSS